MGGKTGRKPSLLQLSTPVWIPPGLTANYKGVESVLMKPVGPTGR